MPQIVLQNTEAFNAVPYYTFMEGGSSPAFNMKLKKGTLCTWHLICAQNHLSPNLKPRSQYHQSQLSSLTTTWFNSIVLIAYHSNYIGILFHNEKLENKLIISS